MKTIKLEFKEDQFGSAIQKVNTILLMLSEGKFKDTFYLIQDIQNQVNPQVQTGKVEEIEVESTEVKS